jgi:hypothetical protein
LVGRFLSFFFGLGVLLWLVRFVQSRTKKDIERANAFLLLFVWLGVALVGLGVYKQEIYDHYYGFFFPAPFILFSGMVATLFDTVKEKLFIVRILTYVIVTLSIILLLSLNIRNSPLKYTPNRQLQRTEEVARKILEESGGLEFNLAVIAERNYEGAYQYFLETWNAPIVKIDPQLADETITEQLFVVCELPEEQCDPTRNPKAEIANYGWSKIEGQWGVAGVILYKLVHSQ